MTVTAHEENPFLGRILSEKVVAGNERFRIVEDREPAVPGHLLLFTLEQVPSLADSDYESLCDLLEGRFSGRKYLLIEKGRGRFCSSFGNIIHAHAHLAPEDCCGKIELPAETARKAKSLREALGMPGSQDEYLLAGKIGEGFQVLSPLNNAPKRLARMILGGTSEW